MSVGPGFLVSVDTGQLRCDRSRVHGAERRLVCAVSQTATLNQD